ncbi:MAG: UbiA family prenyltransferase [Saprospiraceae bacterium]|nr:UbiA family prenyltransferase [Bacteroidia bacterium]NNE16399.1 UbiA family prenyltransferase [Saprospiraceae bacterium]NNL93497.1 UbiA family prenyltransferase [Saprospiraceae bacterium]
MKSVIRPLLNFYIYSSIHISISAALFTFESYLIFKLPINWVFISFVFFATILTYSTHRIVGIKKIKEEFIHGRFKVIKTYLHHIIIYAVIAFCALIWLFTQLNFATQKLLIIPIIISFLYTVPTFKKGKRLRDFNYIKILLIAASWAAIAVIDIYRTVDVSLIFIFWVLAFEKFSYILAITLPFDIRDLEIEKANQVKTIPALIGQKKTLYIVYSLLIICFISMTFILQNIYGFNFQSLLLIFFAYSLSIFAVKLSEGKTSDDYYSGILDGVIAIRALTIAFAFYLV